MDVVSCAAASSSVGWGCHETWISPILGLLVFYFLLIFFFFQLESGFHWVPIWGWDLQTGFALHPGLEAAEAEQLSCEPACVAVQSKK